MLSRFHLIPERYGQTDRFAISISRVSMLTREKKLEWWGYLTVKKYDDIFSSVDRILA